MTRQVPILRHQAGSAQAMVDHVVIEEPLQIWINGKPFATLMRSPGSDAALTAGFLFSEGVIEHASQILSMEPTGHPTSQELHLQLAPGLRLQERPLPITSSCGVCGRSSITSLLDRIPPLTPFSFPPVALSELLPRLAAAQLHFAATGGLHAAALFDEQFRLLGLAEDIGRHNALDKLIGARLLAAEALPARCILLMTSRASFDIVQKSALAGIPAVACLGAASSLAIELARACGQRLFSFLRAASVVEHNACSTNTPAQAPPAKALQAPELPTAAAHLPESSE